MAASGGGGRLAKVGAKDTMSPAAEEKDTEWTREKVLAIASRRDKMEEEMDTLFMSLGSVGLREPLVDSEGFPRADVDVAAIRGARNRHAMLRTDYATVTKEMEVGLLALHAAASSGGGPSPLVVESGAEVSAGAGVSVSASGSIGVEIGSRDSCAPCLPADVADTPSVPSVPFAAIGLVQPGGPGARAGLRIGDAVLCFGDVTADSIMAANASASATGGNTGSFPLDAVARLTQRTAGQFIEIVIRRRSGGVEKLRIDVPAPPRLA